MGAWLKRELKPLLSSVLSREAVERRGLFDWASIARTNRRCTSRIAPITPDHLLALLNLELWSRMYLDGERPADLAEALRETTVAAPVRAAAAGGA